MVAADESSVRKLVQVLQSYVEKLSAVDDVFESASFLCRLRKFQGKSSINEVFSLTKDFVSEIQLLLHEIVKLEKSEVEISDSEENAEADCHGSSDAMDVESEESSAVIQSAEMPNNQYRTRRQRMLREAQIKKPTITKDAPAVNHLKPDIAKSKPQNTRRKPTEKREWSCSECLRIFSSSEFLNKHIQYAHENGDENYEQELDEMCLLDRQSVYLLCCCQCLHTYKDMDTFKSHDCNLKPEELQELDLPIKEGEERLVRHFDQLLELNYLICDQCCEEYRSLERMVCHVAKCKPGPYPCEICSKSFPNKKELNYHKKKNHNDTLSFFCDICDAKYKNRPSLQKHLVNKHEKNVESFKCDECQESFNMKILLTRHKEQLHNLVKEYLCQVCGEGLSNPQSLKIHVARHANKEKKFCCEYCDARFTRKDKLVFHTRTHTGEKPFQCTQCSKRFIRKTKLDEHLRRHKGEKNHECEICQKKFFGANDLRAHQRRTHTSKVEEDAEMSLGEENTFDIETDGDKEGLRVDKEISEILIRPISQATQENLQFATAGSVETLPLTTVDSLIPSVPPQNILTTQSILQPPTSLPMQIMAPTASALQTQTFYQVPQTLQIQLPITMSGTSLELSQVGSQPIILANFNSLNNLQF